MLIGANGNLPQSAYADNAAETKTASVAPVPAAAAPSAPLDKITLSAAALRLIEENNQLAQIASSASQIPPPVSSDSRKAKKRQPSASPMLDVDAFRLIRDKLRAENLEIKAPDPQSQKNKDDKDQATAVSL
jgi:hypothetical protein